MRAFLVFLLKELKILTGVKQYEDIASNPKGKEAAQEELNALLEPMLEVCNLYPFIPDTEKMKIIRARVTDSPEFYGLNARFVKLALERVKDIYWKESGYQETNELLKEEVKSVPPPKEFIELMANLAQDQSKIIPLLAPVELEKAKERPKEVVYSVGIPFGTKEELERRENHRLWILANFDKITGKKLPEWKSEVEWIKLQNL